MEVEVVKGGSEEDIWDVEDLERLEWKPKRKPLEGDTIAYSVSSLQKQLLANSISEFDPFYSSPPTPASKPFTPSLPGEIKRIGSNGKQPSIPIVNLPLLKFVPSRALLAVTSRDEKDTRNDQQDQAKSFRPRAPVAINQPTADISAHLLSDERMYAIIPVHLRGLKRDSSGNVPAIKEGKGRLGKMMDALDEARQIFTNPKAAGSNKHETSPSFDPVPPEQLSLRPTSQPFSPSDRPVSTFGVPTSKISTPTVCPVRPGWVRSNAPSPASAIRNSTDENEGSLPAKPDWIEGSVPSLAPVHNAKDLRAVPMNYTTPPRTTRRDLPDTPESPSERKGRDRRGLRLGRLDKDSEGEGSEDVVGIVRDIVRGRWKRGEGDGAEVGSTRFLLIHGVNRFIQPQAIKERISKIAGLKALVYRYQKDLGIVVLLLHSRRDAIKIQHAIASGEIYLGAPEKKSFESDDEDMAMESGSHSAILPDPESIFGLECYGITAAGVYAIAGEPIRKYIDDCESTLRIQVETMRLEDSSEFMKTLLEEVGPLRCFAKEENRPEIFSIEFEDSRNHEVVLRDLPDLSFDGKSLQVWSIPCIDKRIIRPKPSFDHRFIKPVPPLSPPSTSKKQTDVIARESSSPTPSRPFSQIDKLPITPPRTNQALERLLQGASPTPELLAAVKTEKSKWEIYEQALLSTPGSRVTSNLFRVAQYNSPNFKSTVHTTPNSASKLFSFNSMKSSSNINREELQEAPGPMKGQDSVRYKQEVPQNFRFSLEKLQRGLDTRTTVMIKEWVNPYFEKCVSPADPSADSIPNKLTRDQLIEAIHEVVPRGITFAYLRFDWEFQCNVAYGFVNFRSLAHLEYFARERLGEKWGMFMSDKVLQMSYAFIQGHDALVNHFRNSTVMLTTPEWRPVVLDAKGNIDEFPGPNRNRNHGNSGSIHQRNNHNPATYDWDAAEPCSL